MSEYSVKDKAYEEGQKLAYDSFKHLTTLSTGSLLLLATFLKDLFDKPEWKFLVGVSFIFFIVSIVCSVLTMKALSMAVKDMGEADDSFGNFGAFLYLASIFGFLLGIICFVAFSIKNFY